jgi:hypothetical protein
LENRRERNSSSSFIDQHYYDSKARQKHLKKTQFKNRFCREAGGWGEGAGGRGGSNNVYTYE